MLTSRLGGLNQDMVAELSANVCVEMSKIEEDEHPNNVSHVSEVIMTPKKSRKLKNRSLSYQLSFKSEAEMHSAIKLLKMREKLAKEEEIEFNVCTQDKKYKSEKSSQGEDDNSSEDSRMRTTNPKSLTLHKQSNSEAQAQATAHNSKNQLADTKPIGGT